MWEICVQYSIQPSGLHSISRGHMGFCDMVFGGFEKSGDRDDNLDAMDHAHLHLGLCWLTRRLDNFRYSVVLLQVWQHETGKT